jgi:hypothetical protein
MKAGAKYLYETESNFCTRIVLTFAGCNSKTDRTKVNGTTWGVGSFNSNGQSIYFTSTSDLGTEILYTGGPGYGYDEL